jgi:uncharacterized protein YaiE (UPF0345 family)
VQITAGNYALVAQESVGAAMSVTDAALLLPGAQVSRDHVALDFARAQIPKLQAWMASAPRLVTGAAQTERVPCDSGSMDVTVNDANNNNRFDAGDSFSISAHACMFAGATLSGAMAFTVNAISGDLNTDVYNLNMSMTLTNMVANDATGSVTTNASMSASASSTGPDATTFSIITSSYTTVSTRAGVTYTRSLTDFTATQTTTPTQTGYSVSKLANGTLSSSGLGNKSVVFATLAPFARSDRQNFPTSGQATGTGAGGGKIRVTAQNNGSTVLVELDADGNGIYEASQTKSWAELR